MNAKNMGGLWKVYGKLQPKFLRIFCITEQIFKKHTETCSNKIDGKLITKAVLEDTGVLGNFSKLNRNINYVGSEITKKFLEDLIYMYIKTKQFSLVRSKVDAQKNFASENQSESFKKSNKISNKKSTLKKSTAIKKSCYTPASS